jgi:hypothetical protein
MPIGQFRGILFVNWVFSVVRGPLLLCAFRQAPGSLSSLYRSPSSPWYVRGEISALAVQVKRLGHASRSAFGGAAAGLRGATAVSLTKLSRGFAEFGWIATSCAMFGVTLRWLVPSSSLESVLIRRAAALSVFRKNTQIATRRVALLGTL